MFTCNFCSLQFNTEEELNVHTERCTANVAGPSSESAEVLCRHCKKHFTIVTEYHDHWFNSEEYMKFMLSIILLTVNNLDYYIKNVPRDRKPNQCLYCSKDLNTLREIIIHRIKCPVLKMFTELYTFLQTARRWKEFRYGNVSSMPLDFPSGSSLEEMNIFALIKNLASDVTSAFERSRSQPRPSTSQEIEQTTSSRNRALETDTEKDPATQSESNPEPSVSRYVRLCTCLYCKLTFTTREEFLAHTCDSIVGNALSLLEKVEKYLDEAMEERIKQMALGLCQYCFKELYTMDEVIEHEKTCEILHWGKTIEVIDKNFKKMTSELVDELVTMIPMSLSPKPLTSEENKQNKSSKKRVLDTSTERNNVTKSESSMETSSSPSKICRSSDKDIIDIETGQESATDSKICDAKTKTCAKKSFDRVVCVLCERKFQSLDVLQTHIKQCHGKRKK